MSYELRKKVLQILYEQWNQGSPRALGRKGLSRKIGLEWIDIEHEVDFLVGKGYIDVEKTLIGAQTIEGFSITSPGIDLVEGRDEHSLLSKSVPLLSRDTSKTSILFLASEPTDTARLRLGEELREIQEKLKLAKQRDRFILHQRMAVRPEDFTQALLDEEPQIVHFSGHGTTTGVLCFEDKLGKVHPVQLDMLAALFEQFTAHVNCVILSACYSEAQGNAIAKHIDYVIGMSQAIGDKAAIAFAVGFYQGLGAGRSVESAYKLGCAQIGIQSESFPEHLTPILIRKS